MVLIKGSRRGFLLMELLLVLTLLSLVMTFSITYLKPRDFQEHIKDVAFMNELKGAMIRQRIDSVRQPGMGFNLILKGDGTASFVRQGRTQTVFDDPVYRVYLTRGARAEINTQWNFKSRTLSGSNGYTILVYKNDRLMARLIYQVGTSTFREEYYDNT